MIFVIYGSIWSLKNGVLGLMVVGHVNIKIFKKKMEGPNCFLFKISMTKLGHF